MEKNINEKALESFRSGLNCAQAVFSAYSEKLGFDYDLAVSVSCGFGGGMGRQQGTCGAVTGAYMALGVHNCNKIAGNNERKAHTYAMVQEFSKRFRALHGATDCIDLLKCEIKTQEGHDHAKALNLFETVCEKCITNAISIVDELVTEKD
jgi:C_GCAxxG_C_C family probable redox protein